MQDSNPSLRVKLAPAAVRLAALWVLSVTSIKLFKGSPNDLPEFIRHNFFGPEINFNLSIGVELSCAFIALMHPRRGFALLTALSAIFIAVLLYLISIGATSCGCFGGAIKLSPQQMLSIDGSLLALMLATKPWQTVRPSKFPMMLASIAVVVAFAAPWIKNPPRKSPPLPVATAAGVSAAWQLPPKPWRNSEELPAVKWIGKSIHETELAVWVDTHAHQTDATWILYRVMCPHCADYLRRLFNEFTGEQVYVFVRVPEAGDPEDKSQWAVEQMPPGDLTSLPEGINWDPTPNTPCELVLQGGIVKSATFRGEE